MDSFASADVARRRDQRPWSWRRPGRGGLPERPAGEVRWWVLVTAALIGAALVRLPLVDSRLSSDEGGFLLVAHQWRPGTSLYGDYWVDRPPLLITLYRLADLAGGAVALRLLGVAAVVGAVAAGARLGWLWAGARGAGIGAAVTATFVSSPLMGTREVDGELLALPFVMAGIALVAGATRSRAWIAAGACATAAIAIKQNLWDVVVAAAVVLLWRVRSARPWRRELASFAFGGGVTALAVLGWAALHGTEPAGLWDAVVTFRAEAGDVIRSSASAATPRRARLITGAFLASGAVFVLAAALLPGRVSRVNVDLSGVGSSGPAPSGVNPSGPGASGAAPSDAGASDVAPYGVRLSDPGSSGVGFSAGGSLPPYVDVRWLAGAVGVYEVVGVIAGGSYWLHYLVGLLPGVVLVALVVVRHRPARLSWVVAGLVWAVVVGASAWPSMSHVRSGDQAVVQWLRARARPGDSAVVAFGDPAILWDAGLRSPYRHLWSLPVRTRDPRLAELAGVLDGHAAPRWVLVAHGRLGSWGIHPRRADSVLRARYREAGELGMWTVFEERGSADSGRLPATMADLTGAAPPRGWPGGAAPVGADRRSP